MTPALPTAPIRVLLVDDEPLSVEGMRRRLMDHPGVEIVGEARNGREALALTERESPDMILLDIRMPGLDGFDVIDRLPAEDSALVVLVTAYDRYALEAWERRAFDYILKPVKDERLSEVIARAGETLALRRDAARGRRVAGLEAPDKPAPKAPETGVLTLSIRDRFARVDLPVARIDWIEAERDYARLHCGAKTYLLKRTMTWLEDNLDPEVFLRIHRGVIVNLRFADRLEDVGLPTPRLALADGAYAPIGPKYVDIVRERMKALE